MSVLHVEADFAILDEQLYYNNIFEKIGRKIRPELYEINSKFMPDSQFEAIKKRGISKEKRKRCEKSEDATWIEQIASGVRKVGKEMGYFKESSNQDNNLNARQAAEKALSVITPSTSMSSTQVITFQRFQKLDKLLCNGIISNWIKCSQEKPGVVENGESQKIFIPPGATFHVGDVADVEQYSAINDILFDLVVADPPWFNKSVKRKKTYEMNEQVIDNLDITSITTNDALIVFWITNRKWVEEEMKERFKSWNMEVIATWKWLKITTQGEPVYDLDKEKHKLPYESIVFAKKRSSRREFNIYEKFVFASIPMAVHSHKPPLLELFQHFGIDFMQPLELFARSLLPSTHSIGFEPFLLQSEHVFIPK
ncbi:Protein CBG02487 [Caenorhabditis briggsae]|uniref:Protein CBG02487 n=2 Tax=Caenorhabditis briggsae TaxID=6238 RepID=A8WU74_CAEBR|nr:Protein CBG02487 [Caenorhabditis briggsae]ULU06821.1 hypothetical protein L3Y34_018545 [Caenorhabditis briggsae]CAP24036.1 Protein CBG02487 [Caenorhabditis briggsae]